MVNLILVSHSYQLACGVAELAEQMNNGCQIAVAAGMSEPENAIGTDAVKIMMAIEEVYSDDGVLILMDLGSAILSAETALDLIDPEMAAKVKLCAAPLVEGALAAVVSASAGADLATVAREAESALSAKQSQLGHTSQGGEKADDSANRPPADALHFAWTVQNPHGLHARPTAKVIETLSPFQSQIWLEKNGNYADAKRYNALIQLGVRQHDVIHFYLSGADAKLALQAVQTLAEGHFGESIEHTHGSTQTVQGVAVRAETSEGQAVTFRQQFTLAQFPTEPLGDLAEKQQQLQHAIRITQQQLAELVALSELNDSFSGLFQAHQMLLDELADELLGELSQQSVGEACWQLFEIMKQSYQCLDDPYLQARTLDLDDLRHRLLHNVYGLPIQQPELNQNAILIADELYPSTLAQLLTQRFQGICLQQGNRFSHTALLAQSANIPLLIECGESLKQFALGDKVQVDWQQGEIMKR